MYPNSGHKILDISSFILFTWVWLVYLHICHLSNTNVKFSWTKDLTVHNVIWQATNSVTSWRINKPPCDAYY